MKYKFFLNTHKGFTFLFVLVLMAVYRQWDNTTAWIYLALHGTYGILWVMKSAIFPDKTWERKVSWFFGIVIAWGGLTLYLFPAWLVTSRDVQAPSWLLGLVVSMNIFGVFTHFASDMQKHIQLKLKPEHLISDGMFAYSRNINYFGELLIYAAFALLPMTWLAFLPLALIMVVYWIPGMLRKEKSLSRYPEFSEYKKQSKFFIPFIF